MHFSQIQGFQKRIFEFVYHGTFNIELWKARKDLGLKSVELCLGTHGYRYAMIKIGKKKRASQIQKMFEVFDREASLGMQIRLTNLPDEVAMVSFGQGHEFKTHTIYREIERAMETRSPNYVHWSCDSGDLEVSASSSSTGKATSRLNRLLETDLVPSVLSPICSKRQRSVHTKLSSNDTGLEGNVQV